MGSKYVCAGKGQQQLETTDQSPRQKGHPTSTNLQLSESNKNLVLGPRWVLDAKTDWLTDCQ
jgi:hypothetical protein